MKVTYVTTFDLENPNSWPRRHLGLYGAGAKIIQTLRAAGTDVSSLGPLGRKRNLVAKVKGKIYRTLYKKNFYGGVDPAVAKHHADQINERLSSVKTDILLCPENAVPIANIKTDVPTVLWTDTTLGSLVDFYPYLSNLCQETRKNIFELEKRALDNCSLIILNSDWASEQAQQLYGVSPEKIKVIPRGASQKQTLSDEAFETALAAKRKQACKLLFIGVDWQRKGGDTAFGIAEVLNAQGIETELHIVGCKPPYEVPNFVKLHGFIDKSTTAGQETLSELFKTAHFLLYPSKADAMGVVLSEAASYGVPSLASDVGGISSVVKANVTGKTFAPGSKPEKYGEFVAEQMGGDRYSNLARSTFEHYKNFVSWPAVGEQAVQAFEALLAK